MAGEVGLDWLNTLCKLAHLVIVAEKRFHVAATVYHAKNRNVLILDTINYDVLINGKTAEPTPKSSSRERPRVGMAGKQENRSVMESIRWLATTNFLDNLLVTTNSNTIGLRWNEIRMGRGEEPDERRQARPQL
jgi:hypothetical protein